MNTSSQFDSILAEPSLPVGSLHVWILDRDSNLSIVAVQLKDGAVLQQNDISGDTINYHETFFPSVAAWRASLPEFGRMKIYRTDSDDPSWLNWSLPDKMKASFESVNLDTERVALLALSDEHFKKHCEMIEQDISQLNIWIKEYLCSQEYREKTEELEQALMWKKFYEQIKTERERSS
jgi:hypothetical protein